MVVCSNVLKRETKWYLAVSKIINQLEILDSVHAKNGCCESHIVIRRSNMK